MTRQFGLTLLVFLPWIYILPGSWRSGAGTLVFLAFIPLIKNFKGLLQDKMLKWLSCFSLIGLVRWLLYRDMPLTTLAFTLSMLIISYMPCAIILTHRYTKNEILKAIKLLVYSSFLIYTISVVFAFSQKIMGSYGVLSSGDSRLFGFVPDSAASLVVLCCLYGLRNNFWLFIFGLILLLASQAKGALLVVFFGAILYVFTIRKLTRMQLSRRLIALLIFTIGLYNLPVITERLHNVDYSIGNRLLIIKGGFHILLENWLLGLNHLRIQLELPYLMQYYSDDQFYYPSAGVYNTILYIACSYGILGLIPLFMIFKLIFARAKMFIMTDSHSEIASVSNFLICYLIIQQGINWLAREEIQFMGIMVCYSLTCLYSRTLRRETISRFA